MFSPFWLLRLDWTKTTTQTATEPLPRGTRWDKVRSRTAVSAGTMYGTVFVVRTGVFIQARGQQDTSDIYRFDDMSAEVVKFFLKPRFFHFWAWIKKKKENRWRGTWTTRNVRINDTRTIDPRWAIDTDTVNSLKGLHTLQLCWFFGPGKINKKYAEEPVNSPWPGWLGESIEWPGGTQSVLYKLPHRSHTKP